MKPPRHPMKIGQRVECLVPGYAIGTDTHIALKTQGTTVRYDNAGNVTVAFEFRMPVTAVHVIEEPGK